MKVLYISQNMNNYRAAMYQQDVMEEFSKQTNVVFYGPGFKGFEPYEHIKNVINKIGGVDFIIVGHSWLLDKSGVNIDPYPSLHLEDSPIKKYVILNKEYTNLDAKLKWIKEKSFDRAFTHHHDINIFEKRTSVPFSFIPFAFNKKLFEKFNGENKDIDFAFSGLLKNIYHKNNTQSDARILIMKKLFYCFGDIPIFLKKKYSNYKIFWNSLPRFPWQQKISILIKNYRYLKNEEYVSMTKRSRVYLNSLSPGGLVGTRFFENMASKALVFCEESENLRRIFPSNSYISFKKDLSDFEERFEFALSDSSERTKIVNDAYELAMINHSWEDRVKKIIDLIQIHNLN